MDKLYVADTNVLLDSPEIISKYKVVILSHVIRELDKHKTSRNYDLSYRARYATRNIKKNKDNIVFDTLDYNSSEINLDNTYQDNNILYACIKNGYGLITNDLLLQLKAESHDIETIELNDNAEIEYKGVLDVYLNTNNVEDQKELAKLYENTEENFYDLVENQYLIAWDTSKPTYDEDGNITGYEVIDKFKWQGNKLNKLKFKPVSGKFLGKIKPINEKQEPLFDLLQNRLITIKACVGKFGVGKDFVMISHALELIEQGKMDKLIWARNNVELQDVPTLGILPGDTLEKLIGFAMPLADHLGGVEGLELLIRSGKIEIQHLGSLRGRDIKNSIIYCTEFQNNTSEHAKLLIGRVGQGSELWLNGDLMQTDKEVFRQNSALRSLSKLKGNKLFGQVTLDKIERSETAQLSELL